MSQDPIVQTPAGDVPAGFERGPGGLLVPTGATPLAREVWRWEDGMAIRRAWKVAQQHHVLLILGCQDDRCAEHPQVEWLDLPGGGFAWRCGHLERHVTKGPRR